MRVSVDPDACQGHGLCQLTAPDVFAPTEEDGHAYVLQHEVAGEDATAAADGAAACPERAITVAD